MTTISNRPMPSEVFIEGSTLRVLFKDGTERTVAIDRFPRLLHATAQQRSVWEVIGRGSGIHWPEIDEDISMETILGVRRTILNTSDTFEEMLQLIGDLYETTRKLKKLSGGRAFTPDGQLVSEIGKVVAEYVYGLNPNREGETYYDARTRAGNTVQVMLTGENSKRYAIRWSSKANEAHAEVLLCLRLTLLGFEEIYNGPFPRKLLSARPATNNRQVHLSNKQLLESNPAFLTKDHSLASVNQWLAPKLADVA